MGVYMTKEFNSSMEQSVTFRARKVGQTTTLAKDLSPTHHHMHTPQVCITSPTPCNRYLQEIGYLHMISRSNILTRFVSSSRNTSSLLQKIRWGWVTHINSPTSIRLKHGMSMYATWINLTDQWNKGTFSIA